jgi:GNAT superfamily N-acetyltransferase
MVDGTVAGMTVATAIAELEDNLWDMWSAFGRGEGCRLIDRPELLLFETPIPHIPYNSGVEDRIDDTIDEVLAAYTRRQVPLVWVVHPTSRPHDLDARLEARGLVEAEVCSGMVASLSELPPPTPFPEGVDVQPLGPAGRDEFVELVAWRYSLPPLAAAPLLSIMEVARFGHPECRTKAWVARIDGRIVAKVILHLTAGSAGLYGVATRLEARGLGLASNLTSLAFDHARTLGSTVGVLHSTPVAVKLYRDLGFRHAADFRLFSTPGTLHL